MNTGGKTSKENSAAASFTIEAAVVIPVILVLLTAVLYISFRIHDHVILPAVMEYAILDLDPDSREACPAELAPFLESRMILPAKVSITFQGTAKHSKAAAVAQFPAPLILLPVMPDDTAHSFAMQITVSNLNGRGALLPYKALCDGIKKIKQ